nr:extensin-2-like [Ipomoea batatas]
MKSLPPPYHYTSPPPPKKSPPPPYYYVSPPPPIKSPPPPYYYSSPPPPKKSPTPSYYYTSPPPPKKSPPSPYYYTSPPPPTHHYPPHYDHLVVKVVGKVYCFNCYDSAYPEKSHNKKHLKGAIVEVTCTAGEKKIVAYGTTKINGKYSIEVKEFDYSKYGGKACKAKLHTPPKGSKCNIPTNFHMGIKGATLRIKSKTHYEVVLYAKSFAYAPKTPHGEFLHSTPQPHITVLFTMPNPSPREYTCFEIVCRCPPRPRKKSIAQKPAPAAKPDTTPFQDPKLFDRYKFFSERRVFQPYILTLDVAEQFGIRDEVEELVSLPEWRYLLMDFREDTHPAVLVEMMTTLKIPKDDGLTCSPYMTFSVRHFL